MSIEQTGYLPIGTQLGEYQITDILGQGGFGITYKAWDSTLECDVAIKEYFPKQLASRDSDTISIKTTISSDAEAFAAGLRSFVKEAQVLAKFQHSAIVPVKRLVRANDTAYMIMGFVEGESLSDYLQAHENRVDPNTLTQWTKELLSGLRLVHAQGLLHRDIKPGNIYIKSDGGAMLLDFGAARQSAGEASMSVTGLFSAGYSPPEQYSDRTTNQGPWSDIYALSATLYRCVEGTKPAAAPDRTESIQEEEGDLVRELSPSSSPGYAAGFLAAINKGLDIRRTKRLQSVEAFEALISSEGVPTTGQAKAAVSQPPPIELPTEPAVVQQRVSKRPAKQSPNAAVKVDKANRPLEQAQQRETIAPKPDAESSGFIGFVIIPGVIIFILCVAISLNLRGWFDSQGDRAQRSPAQLGITLADIPAGSFRMGDLTGNGVEREKPVRTVSVSAFKIMTTEVTWNHYQPCIDAGVCANPNDMGWGRGDRPVIWVSWDDAQTYINWLEEETGLSWRLPSEAEWEYAARAGTTTDYNWNSNSISANQANYSGSGNSKTVEVDRYSTNRWGLYNMNGNVWEWTQDCWNTSYQGAPSNGSAWEPGDCNSRVLRGGSWDSIAWYLRSSTRFGDSATYRDSGNGFRLVQGQ